MKHCKHIHFIFLTFILLIQSSYAMTAKQAKALVKTAVIYALETRDPRMDYGKYVSRDFINPIDGHTFNYQQWVTHQKDIKKMIKLMKPTFDLMIAEKNQVATIYTIDLVKNDGSKLQVKDFAFFKIKNKKIVYCEEITRLIIGNKADKNIGSTK